MVGYHQYERLSGEILSPLILMFAQCKHQYERWEEVISLNLTLIDNQIIIQNMS